MEPRLAQAESCVQLRVVNTSSRAVRFPSRADAARYAPARNGYAMLRGNRRRFVR